MTTLKEARVELNLTRKEFASLAGVHSKTVWETETKAVHHSYLTAQKMANAARKDVS